MCVCMFQHMFNMHTNTAAGTHAMARADTCIYTPIHTRIHVYLYMYADTIHMHTRAYISTYRGAMSLHTQYQHPNATHPSTWAGKFLESVPIFGLTKQTFPDCHLVLGQGFRVQGLDPGGHVQVCANKGSRLSAPKCAWLVMISGSGGSLFGFSQWQKCPNALPNEALIVWW